MALLNNLIDFDPIVDALWKKFEPKVDAFFTKVLALLPVLAATLGKEMMDKLPFFAKAVLDKDPDLPIVSDIFDLSEYIRGKINDDDRIPIQLPGLDVLGNLFGRR